MRAFIIDLHFKNCRRTLANRFEILVRVKVQMEIDAKPAPQRRSNQSGPGRGAYQSELGQFEFDRASPGTLTDQEIQAEVLHRGIKLLFQRRQETMDLVYKKHVAFLEVR